MKTRNPTFRQEVDQAIKALEGISTKRIVREIASLARTLEAVKGSEAKIIVFTEFSKIQRAYLILIEVKRHRDGFQTPEEAIQTSKKTRPTASRKSPQIQIVK